MHVASPEYYNRMDQREVKHKPILIDNSCIHQDDKARGTKNLNPKTSR